MSTLTQDTQAKVEALILKNEILSKPRLESLRTESTNIGKPFFSHLVAQGALQEEDLTRFIAEVSSVPYVNLVDFDIKPEVLSLLPQDIAERFMSIPLGEMEGKLVVAMLDGNNVQAVDFLANKIGRPLKVYMASESSIKSSLTQYKTDLAGGISSVIDESTKDREANKSKLAANLKVINEDSPVSRALSAILEYAVKAEASDIHAEPFENEFKIRVRVDGVLREVMKLPKSIEPAFVSRVKILSNLKIDEHRIPQDGQFDIEVAGKEIDLRIAISPTIWGEQIVIRILDKSGGNLNLESLGYSGRNLSLIRKVIKNPYGMIITSGPTGSGKSTSLYTLLKEVKDESVNIVTLEDPVEYKMDGINQIQINAGVGLTFASGLRSILRHDPDIIMVGEIRDAETARLAIQAALTGHLVFSTLHTNSAAGVLPRLLDMGIEPYLIASTVNAIIGQRLVRKIGGDKEEFTSSEIQSDNIKQTLSRLLPQNEAGLAQAKESTGYDIVPMANQTDFKLYRGKDSKGAPDGYSGRVGIYEVMDVNNEIEQLILQRATTTQLEEAAKRHGMVTMREDGYLKALNGLTTLEEINRVTAVTLEEKPINSDIMVKDDDQLINQGGQDG